MHESEGDMDEILSSVERTLEKSGAECYAVAAAVLNRNLVGDFDRHIHSGDLFPFKEITVTVENAQVTFLKVHCVAGHYKDDSPDNVIVDVYFCEDHPVMLYHQPQLLYRATDFILSYNSEVGEFRLWRRVHD